MVPDNVSSDLNKSSKMCFMLLCVSATVHSKYGCGCGIPQCSFKGGCIYLASGWIHISNKGSASKAEQSSLLSETVAKGMEYSVGQVFTGRP